MKKISLAKIIFFVLIFILICVFVLSRCSKDSANARQTMPIDTTASTTTTALSQICNHSFGDWITSKEATCYEEGEAYRICDNCGEQETQKLSITDEHNFSIENTDPIFLASNATCFSPATYYYSCVCGEKCDAVFEYGELSDHTYNAENTCMACGNYIDAGVVFSFDEQTKTYCVTKYNGSATEIIIPSVYKGFPVSGIGEFAFASCNTIISVKLPSSITSIGFAAFSSCASLRSVTLGNSVHKIGGYAFSHCVSLKNIALPNTLTEIEHNAFEECNALTEITIPDSTSFIGESAFYHCASLRSVTLGKSLKKIDRTAFSDCTELASIEFPIGLTEIGATAFYNCTSLTEIVIPNTVEIIGDSAFAYCDKITKVTLPFLGDKKNYPTNGTLKYIFPYRYEPGIKEVILTGGNYSGLSEQIPNYAFEYYYSIEKIVLPDTIVIIGDYAFANTSLSDIALPDSLKTIGKYAFSGCKFTTFTVPDSVTFMGEYMLLSNRIESLTLPFIGERHSDYGQLEHILGFHVGSSLKEITITIGNKYGEKIFVPHYAFQYWTTIETINLPEGITHIGQNAFYGCSSLKNINIPDSITVINSYAFYECTSLTSINIPNGTIGDFVFCGCTELKDIYLGYVSSIGESAFMDCTSITKVVIPNSVTKIGISAFTGCNALAEMSIPFTGSQAGFNASIKYFGYIFARNHGIDAPASAYQSDVPKSLKTVYYTSGEDMLWHNAFENCNYIEKVYISEGLKTIGNRAFAGSEIKYISLPKSLITIGTSAFESCEYLETIVLGGSLTTINNNAFNRTSALKNVYFRGTEEEWNTLMQNVREEYLNSATKHYDHTA